MMSLDTFLKELYRIFSLYIRMKHSSNPLMKCESENTEMKYLSSI